MSLSAAAVMTHVSVTTHSVTLADAVARRHASTTRCDGDDLIIMLLAPNHVQQCLTMTSLALFPLGFGRTAINAPVRSYYCHLNIV